MISCACLKNSHMTPIVLKARQITFDTSILKHTVMKVFSQCDSPFICPNESNQCSQCSIEALAQSLHQFENRTRTRRKSA